MTEPTELSKKQIEYFGLQVKKWADFFRLADWEILTDSEDFDDAYAKCAADVCSRLSTISVAETWDIKPTQRMLSLTAFHEVAELLLAELHQVALSRVMTYEDEEAARHRVIRTLESVIFNEKWK